MRQTETAALKQGSNSKNQIFSRELTEIYTTATYLGDAVVCESSSPSYMMCILDAGEDKVLCVFLFLLCLKCLKIAMVAVSLRTSALCYDVFQDNFVRTQLETRLAHLQPVELLVCTTMASAATQGFVKVRFLWFPVLFCAPLSHLVDAGMEFSSH